MSGEKLKPADVYGKRNADAVFEEIKKTIDWVLRTNNRWLGRKENRVCPGTGNKNSKTTVNLEI